MYKISFGFPGMLRVCVVSLVVLSLCFAPTALMAAAQAAPNSEVSTSDVAERFGVVASHVKLHSPEIMRQEFSALHEAGATWVRLDLAWPDLEPTRGAWDFSGADLAIQLASENGLQVLAILGASPLWANGGMPWDWPPTDLAAWNTYVSTVATRYADQVAAWEIWNEENISAFWMPWPNAASYMELLRPASDIIRAVDPDGTIVMGGMAGLGADYLEECLRLGAAAYVDALAYHPYPETITFMNYTPQEATCRDLVRKVQGLIAEYTSKDLQIWITELGWTTTSPGIDRRTQAAYMLRSLINYADTAVERVFVHNLRDEYDRPYDPEQNYGLLTSDGAAKPSCDYYQFVEEELGDAIPASSEGITLSCSDNSKLEAHAFLRGEDGLILALWRSDDVSDRLSVTVAEAGDRIPVTVNPATRTEQPVANVQRDAAGSLTIRDLPIGKEPLLLKLQKKTEEAIPGEGTPPGEEQLCTQIREALPWFQILWGLRHLLLCIIGLI